MAISWTGKTEFRHDNLNDPNIPNWNTMDIRHQANEQSKIDTALGYQAQSKEWHHYKGFIANRNKEYPLLWGPLLDNTGNMVDGLPGLFNNFRAMETAIDKHLADRAIQEKRKQDNIAKHRAPPPEEPSPVVEEPIEQTAPSVSYVSTAIDAKEALRDKR